MIPYCPTCGHMQEPQVNAIVRDNDGDAWQMRLDGWNCTVHDDEYKNVPWHRLIREFGPVDIIYTPADS